MSSSIRVGILMGSDSDLPRMKECAALLDRFGIGHEVLVASAHRTPERVAGYARSAAERGVQVIIAGAGMAAHLAGAVAANTVLPVIGVPLSGSALGGLDALLATVQMPTGVPVATVAIDGAKNAAVLAAEIVALGDPEVRQRLLAYRAEQSRRATVGEPAP